MKPLVRNSLKGRFLSLCYIKLFIWTVRIPLLSEIVNLATNKVIQFLRIWQYLSLAKVPGDYLEFGVYKGTSFELSLRAASRFFEKGKPDSPRFFAFDSFQGLSEPDPKYDGGVFAKGEYNATEDVFKKTIKKVQRGWDVITLKGFYETSLTEEAVERHQLKVAAFVTIDCDLYQPTFSALRFITPLLQSGSVIYFDDWYYSHGDMRLGEAGACAAWLKENPSIALVDYGNVGVMGKVFIVNKK